MKAVVLDAMGVIYSVGDDVADLLVPFTKEKGGTGDIARIERLYHSASLGIISSAELWESIGVDPGLEDEYLQRHALTDGLIEFLGAVTGLQDMKVWCLSNDLSEWSKKLRARFGLDRYFDGFVISGDVGVRKPDRAIFECLLERMNVGASEVVFVDDLPKNLDSAARLGFNTILFAAAGVSPAVHGHRVAHRFQDILTWLS